MRKIPQNIYISIVERLKNLDTAVYQYNRFIDDLNEKVAELLDEQISRAEVIDGLIEDLRESVEEITEAQDDYHEARSDTWKESDAGDQYTEWMEAWSALKNDLPNTPEAEDLEIEQMEEVDPALLENLTREP